MRCFIALAACGLASFSFAAESWWNGAKPPAVSKADIQDIVFCSDSGLRKIRLHIQVNGRSASNSWSGFLSKAFKLADRNNDGWLNSEEVRLMLKPVNFQQGFNSLFGAYGQQGGFNELDTDKNGKVSRDEYDAHFRRSGLGVIQVIVQPTDGSAELLTKAFFNSVGGSGKGTISKTQLGEAWARLAALDIDEDEILNTQELLQQQPNPFGYQVAQTVDYGLMAPPSPTAGAFISIAPTDTPKAAADKILQSLQTSKKSHRALTLARHNMRAPGFLRSALQQLETSIIVDWLQQPAELELHVAIGTISDGISRLVNRNADPGIRIKATGRNTDLEKATGFGADGRLRLTMAAEIVEFARTPNAGSNDGTATYYRQLFNTESGAKKYMSKSELQQSPNLQFLVNAFDQIDRDADGKLFVAEFNAVMELLSESSGSQLSIRVVDQGRGLFDVLDVNRDRRLSRRELLDAAKNFASLDRNGNGVLDRDELPRQFRMTVGQGSVYTEQFVTSFDPSGMGMVAGRSVPARGPAWFRKMDRNRDGDVSLREFLGTPEEFKKVDADNDGLVSVAEAEAFDKKQKK